MVHEEQAPLPFLQNSSAWGHQMPDAMEEPMQESAQLTRGKRQEPSLWPCSQEGLTCYTWLLVWGASIGRLPPPSSLWPAVGGG